jgi:predicted Zn-dependent protease with MMP-like domain
MERKEFEKLVEQALAGLPRRFKKLLHNLAVIVEDNPPRDMSSRRPSSSSLLGLYHGVPFKHRGSYYGNVPPDVIVIYQRPIERISSSEDEIRERVKEVVLHEIGHYFGLSEEELRKIQD